MVDGCYQGVGGYDWTTVNMEEEASKMNTFTTAQRYRYEWRPTTDTTTLAVSHNIE
jgi:hypothetical protein